MQSSVLIRIVARIKNRFRTSLNDPFYKLCWSMQINLVWLRFSFEVSSAFFTRGKLHTRPVVRHGPSEVLLPRGQNRILHRILRAAKRWKKTLPRKIEWARATVNRRILLRRAEFDNDRSSGNGVNLSPLGSTICNNFRQQQAMTHTRRARRQVATPGELLTVTSEERSRQGAVWAWEVDGLNHFEKFLFK